MYNICHSMFLFPRDSCIIISVCVYFQENQFTIQKNVPCSASPVSSSFRAFSMYGRHCDSEGTSSSAANKKQHFLFDLGTYLRCVKTHSQIKLKIFESRNSQLLFSFIVNNFFFVISFVVKEFIKCHCLSSSYHAGIFSTLSCRQFVQKTAFTSIRVPRSTIRFS